MARKLYITECPRDAMQGIRTLIPTAEKVAYLNLLLQVGFDRIDAGSFVSPKAIPQMADTSEVFKQLDLRNCRSEILSIVANLRGAEQAADYEMVQFLGFPFSVSETFQQRNTNAGMTESLQRLEEIQNICTRKHKKLQVYLSMAFGNPYGDPWSPEWVLQWALKIKDLGIRHIALADTTGVSDATTISTLFSQLIPALPEVEISAHLHALPSDVASKAKLAWTAGCNHFDTALKGLGGCPMASDALTGNMDTELLFNSLIPEGAQHQLDIHALGLAAEAAQKLFNKYH